MAQTTINTELDSLTHELITIKHYTETLVSLTQGALEAVNGLRRYPDNNNNKSAAVMTLRCAITAFRDNDLHTMIKTADGIWGRAWAVMNAIPAMGTENFDEVSRDNSRPVPEADPPATKPAEYNELAEALANLP